MTKKGLEGTLYQVSVNHFYLVTGFFTPVRRRHNCLPQGFWCWKNFLRHPQDVVAYFKKRRLQSKPEYDEFVDPVEDTRYSGQEK